MEQKKTIAFVSNTLWSIFRFRFSLIKNLLSDGYHILVIAPADETERHFAGIPGLQFIPLAEMSTGFASPFRELKLFRELKIIYLRHQPNLIFHYTIKPNILGSFAARSAGIRSVAVVTGMGYAFVNKPLLRSIAIPLYKKAVRQSAQVWFLNEGDKIFFVRKGIINTTQSFLLPGEGIDTSWFAPVNSVPNPKEQTHFLMIARILKNKGVKEFAAAAALVRKKYPETVFTIMGKYDPTLPDAVSESEFQHFLEQKAFRYIPQSDDVRIQISEADCVVLPSYAEGLSMSLMEGASMEKPILATNVSGCRELVLHGISGYLCEPKDIGDLAEKMESLIALKPENRKMMGRNWRHLMLEKYELRTVIGIYRENIQKMLKRNET